MATCDPSFSIVSKEQRLTRDPGWMGKRDNLAALAIERDVSRPQIRLGMVRDRCRYVDVRQRNTARTICCSSSY